MSARVRHIQASAKPSNPGQVTTFEWPPLPRQEPISGVLARAAGALRGAARRAAPRGNVFRGLKDGDSFAGFPADSVPLRPEFQVDERDETHVSVVSCGFGSGQTVTWRMVA